MIEHKQKLLVDSIKTKKIKVSWHNPNVSLIEAVLARGDRRLSDVIYTAWKNGCKFDSWGEYFKFDVWIKAFEECGLDPEFYACRKREYDEIMPWEHMDYFVSKEFLIRENKRAREFKTTPHCREKCSACGVNKIIGGACFD